MVEDELFGAAGNVGGRGEKTGGGDPSDELDTVTYTTYRTWIHYNTL